MKKSGSFHEILFITILLFLSEFTVLAAYAKSQTEAPSNWPTQIGNRNLRSYEHAFIYTPDKSFAEKANKIIDKVIKELDKDNLIMPGKGLVLIVDTKEKLPFELEKMMNIYTKKENHSRKKQDIEKAMEILKDGKKEFEEFGMDINLLFSITPFPIEPYILPELIEEFPEDVNSQVDWCVTIPTERYIKHGMRKLLDAGLKKEKIGLAKRVALFPLLAIAENKAINELKEARQLVLYELFIDKQKNLKDKQKEEMVKSYEKRL